MKEYFQQELKILWIAALALFISIAFVVTIAFLFFFRSIDLPSEQIRSSAIMTFVVVLALSVLFLAGYETIRYLTVIRPLQKINLALSKIAAGDFTERLPYDGLYGNYATIVKNINLMTDELAASALMKTDFVSNVSHELKTPLAVINNYGTLLQTPQLSEADRVEYAQTITSASRRMSELITNILRLNRLENQQLDAKKEPFDLGSQLGECLLQYEPVWEANQIDLEVDLADGVVLNSDPELLSLVWNNLLSNAFKFTEPGGRVAVSMEAGERCATVTVADSGCGIDAETGRHIFDKFYQGDTSHSSQGNGLGLALVKRVIDIIGGEISVSSIPGEGSTFTVKVPMSKK